MTSKFFFRSTCLGFMAAGLLCAPAVPGAIAAPPDHAQGKPPAHAQGPKPPANAASKAPLVIEDMGARFFATGKKVGDPLTTGTVSCDHGYVDWAIPKGARSVPLLMVHASGQKTWDTTWDGRDGFKNIFLRKRYPVYLTDLPRTGRAGQGCVSYTYEVGHGRPDRDQNSINSWRYGIWLIGMPEPEYYPGVQFDPNSLDQFLPIQYPEFNAPDNEQVETDAMAELLEEIGPSVVLTHSSTGIRGWILATKSDKVLGISGYEPGAYGFRKVSCRLRSSCQTERLVQLVRRFR